MNAEPGVPKMPALCVHNIAIQTANFSKAFAFYADLLSLPVVREPFEFKGQRQLAWFDGGSVLIELYSVKFGRHADAYGPDRVGPEHIAFEVPDLDVIIERLEFHGVKPIRPPFRPPSGDPGQPRVMFVLGPDGEEIQFREPHGS